MFALDIHSIKPSNSDHVLLISSDWNRIVTDSIRDLMWTKYVSVGITTRGAELGIKKAKMKGYNS